MTDALRKCDITLSSSAAVERQFSSSKVLTAQRRHLADEAINKLIFLRNKFLKNKKTIVTLETEMVV